METTVEELTEGAAPGPETDAGSGEPGSAPQPAPELIEPAARRRVSEPPKPFQLGEVPPTLEPAPAEPAAQPFRRGDPSE